MNKYIPEKIAELDEYIPDNGKYALRADANESPYLPSAAMLEGFGEVLLSLEYNRYPDSEASELVGAYAGAYGLSENEIVAGNGSDELISVIASAFLCPGDPAVVLLPDFSMYAFYAKIGGAEIIPYRKHKDFVIDFDDVSETVRSIGAKLVIFSNPCNPTGIAADRDTVVRFIEKTDALVVVDEAYMEFCRRDCSVLDLAGKYENLIVLKTLSKAFGLAALRCGFAVGQKELITAMKKVKSPYNVNMLTQRLATVVLRHADEIRANVDEIVSERERLSSALAMITADSGMRIYPSDTNFVLLDADGHAEEIFERMKADSVKIRLMSPYLRITACDRRSDDMLLGSFEKAYRSISE